MDLMASALGNPLQNAFIVMPAKPGIQSFKHLDAGFRQPDDLFRASPEPIGFVLTDPGKAQNINAEACQN